MGSAVPERDDDDGCELARVELDHLLQLALLTTDECLTPGFSLEFGGLRNQLTIVRTARYTLACKDYPNSVAADRECAALDAIEASSPARFQIPTLVRREKRRVFTRTAPSLEPLGDRWFGRPPTLTSIGRLADALAELHSIDPRGAPEIPPIIFDPAFVSAEVLSESPAVRAVLKQLQESALTPAMERLRSDLDGQPRALCHGDIRGENILLDRNGRSMTIIDWEGAGVGAPWMDLGAGLAMLIELAVLVARGVPDPVLLKAFLSRYASRSSTPIDLSAVLRCCGVRLMQAAVEYAAADIDVSSESRRLATVGTLATLRPTEAGIRLGVIA